MKTIKKAIIVLSVFASAGINAEDLGEITTNALEAGLNNAMSKMGASLDGVKDTFLGIDPSNIIKGQSTNLTAGFLEAQCKIPQFDLGNQSGICSRFAGGITNAINQFLGSKIGLSGICEFGTNANVCQDNYLMNMCKSAESTVKEWTGIINDKIDQTTDAGRKKIEEALGKAMNSESSVMIGSARYQKAFMSPRQAQNGGGQDQCLFQDTGDDAELYYGEKANEKNQMLSIVKNAVATSQENSTAAQSFVMDCMKKIPTNDLNEGNIDKYLEMCSARNYTGQSIPETMNSQRAAAAKLSAPSHSSPAQNQQEIKEKANKIVEQCSDIKDTSEIAGCIQKAYQNETDSDKASAANRFMESTNTTEYYSALADMLLTYNYTKEKLDKIPSNKRAYAAMQSVKENERNVLILANLQKLQRLREELNTLTENYKNVCAEAEAGTIIHTKASMEMIDKINEASMNKAQEEATKAINSAGAGGGGNGSPFGGNGGGFENMLNQSGQNIANSLSDAGKSFLEQAINTGAQVAGNYIQNAVGEKLAQIDPTGVISSMTGDVIGKMTSSGIQSLGGDLMASLGNNNSLDFTPMTSGANTPNATDMPGGSGTLVTDQGGSGVMGTSQAEIDNTLNNNPNLGGGGSLKVGD